MDALFLKIVNMSIAASWLILAVILLRVVLKKAPKWINVLLWALVAVRLLCPIFFESSLSFVPNAEPIPQEIFMMEPPENHENAVLDPVENSNLPNVPSVSVDVSVEQIQWDAVFATFGWMFGMAAMLVYAAVSYILVKRKVKASLHLRDNIWICDDIQMPFILGAIKPSIYIPSGTDEAQLPHIIAHENAHLKRRDNWWKPLGFFVLAIHWFNPLVWVAYILLCRDIELACDEKVIRDLNQSESISYSEALLSCSVNRRVVMVCPLAFGEVGVKERVKRVLNYKKPTFWIMLAAVISCVVVAVCFLTNPVAEVELGDIESVTVDNISVSDEATAELVSLINSHRCTPFRVGLDDPNSLSRAIQLNCANGDFYVLHYQYYSGFSFDLRHPGEDDYRSILTFFTAEDGGQKAWKMEYEFDAKLKEWLSEYSSPSFGAFSINRPYGVIEVTYQSPLTSFSMVAQMNTPEYMLDENNHLFSVKEYSDALNWTDLGEIGETTITKENFDDLFRTNSGDGWWTRESASAIRRNTAKAWSVIYNQEKLYYILQQENGELYLAYGYYDYSEKDDPGSDDTYIRWLYKLAPQSSENVLCVKIEDYIAGATQEPRYNIFDLRPFDGEGVTLPGVYTAMFVIDEVEDGITHVAFDAPLYQDGYETHGLQMKAGESLTLRTSLSDEYTAYTFSIISMADAETLISIGNDKNIINRVDPTSVTRWFDHLKSPNEMHWDHPLEISLPEFPGVTFRSSSGSMEAVEGDEIIQLYTGMPIWSAYFCDLTGDGLPELCSSLSWGSGMIDNRVIIYDYANGVSYSLEDRGVSDYTLRQDESDGQLYVDKTAHVGGGLLSTGRLVFEDDCLQVLWPEKPNDNIREITDPTDDPNFAYDTAVEKIFEDERNEYYISGLYSQHIIVHYTDGTQEDIVTALNAGRATFADLDKFGIRYWAEPKPTSFDIAENTVAEIGRGTLKSAVELSDEDAAGLLSLIESGYWVEAMDTSDCKNDCAVNLGGRLIYYCSECGTFTEYRLSEMSTMSHQSFAGARFWTMQLAERLFVNNILCKYIDLMYGVTDVPAPS